MRSIFPGLMAHAALAALQNDGAAAAPLANAAATAPATAEPAPAAPSPPAEGAPPAAPSLAPDKPAKAEKPAKRTKADEPATDGRTTMAWTGAGHAIKLNTLVSVPADLADTLRSSGRARDAERAEIEAYDLPIHGLDAV